MIDTSLTMSACFVSLGAQFIIFRSPKSFEFTTVLIMNLSTILNQILHQHSLKVTGVEMLISAYSGAAFWIISYLSILYLYQNRLRHFGVVKSNLNLFVIVTFGIGSTCAIITNTIWVYIFTTGNGLDSLFKILSVTLITMIISINVFEIMSVLSISNYIIKDLLISLTSDFNKFIHALLVLVLICLDLYSCVLFAIADFDAAGLIVTSIITIKPYLYIFFYSLILRAKPLSAEISQSRKSRSKSN